MAFTKTSDRLIGAIFKPRKGSERARKGAHQFAGGVSTKGDQNAFFINKSLLLAG